MVFVVGSIEVLDKDNVDVSLRVPVLLMVVLFGKLMMVDEVDAVDMPLLELVPIVIAVAVVVVLQRI